MKRVPAHGLLGVALREAAASEFRAVVSLVRQALAVKLYPGRPDGYVEVFPASTGMNRPLAVLSQETSQGTERSMLTASPGCISKNRTSIMVISDRPLNRATDDDAE